MLELPNTPVKPTNEFTVRVPDQGHQFLLLQAATARGLNAVIPGRSRRRVLLKGTRPEVQAAVNEAARLGLLLDLRRLEALEDLLQKKDLQVPLKLASALMMAEVKVALAYGKIPKLEKPTAAPGSKGREGAPERTRPSVQHGGITPSSKSRPDVPAQTDEQGAHPI
jgi:hypothetical protein